MSPPDPLYPQTRADLSLIGIEAAWGVQQGCPSTLKVAVIDSGVDATHPDLSGAVDLANSYNFADANANIFDDLGHGTRVAGILGAQANNAKGIAGVAFGCRLLSLDVADTSGTVTVANVVSAIDWARSKGASVINAGVSFHAASQALASACSAAIQAGAMIVAPAGNENQGDTAVYPAAISGVLGVGAVMDDGVTRCPWSNYNGRFTSLVDLVAPGETIFSTAPGGQYGAQNGSGTSFAAPMVSGVAALLKAKYPAQSGAAIAQQLLATAKPVGTVFQPAGGAGRGLLNAAQALATPMKPELAITQVKVDDAKAYAAANNADGIFQKGEKVRLIVTLRNNRADALAVTGTLATTDALVTLGDTHGAWGNLASGQSKNPSDLFTTVTLSASSPAHVIPFTLKLAASGGFTQTLSFEVRAESFTTPPAIISANTTWTSDKTYLIKASTVVMPTAKLTIQPGTTLRFEPAGKLEVRGALDAQGTAAREITWTSIKDLPYGAFDPTLTHMYENGTSPLALGDVDSDGKKRARGG